MQLFARCGSHGTLVLEAGPSDTFGCLKVSVMERLPELGPASQLALFYRGRTWRDGCSLRRARLAPGATLEVQGRLRGGGGDGGSTGAESRSSYLEMYATKKKDKVNPLEEKRAKWTTCHLSGEPLAPPCCADELGNLFNKAAIVEALVSKAMPKSLPHITGLKSLIDIKLTPNPHADGRTNGRANGSAKSHADFQPGNEADWVCPVSGRDMNGRFRFVVLRRSGHVVSEKALKEARPAVEELVGGGWEPDSVLLLNPEGEELDAARAALLVKLAAAKAKKAKKKAKNGGEAHEGEANGAPPAKKARLPPPGPDSAVYRSIFRDPTAAEKETYCCRSTSARGMNLT